jgi:tRNA (cmo5U34)-methyltransferase
MTGFKNSNWTKPEYSRDYRENADNFIPERRTLLGIVASFYRSLVVDGRKKRVLDLGCGDGILAETLFHQDRNVDITVTDGSEEMLAAARKRLTGLPVVEFCRVTFEEILSGIFQKEPFDFIVSGFAIHHLEMPQKARLFQSVTGLLNPGCFFLNIDATMSGPFTDWYYRLWKEWILTHEESTRADVSMADVPAQARAKPENHYDPLQEQLDALKNAGFIDVECHYKYGLFVIYGGRKPGGVK